MNYSSTFELFNFCHYLGPNPYLNAAAVTFDAALSTRASPLPIESYQQEMGRQLPQLLELSPATYGELIAQTVAAANQLEMGLHPEGYRVTAGDGWERLAVPTLDQETSFAAAQLVWDWLEAITEGETFPWRSRLRQLQDQFRRSIYGGPTSYALLRAARERAIPTFYLPQERLLQYGYGRYQVRGISTTFDRDSHLDSDFTTQKDDCKDFLARCGFPVPQGRLVRSFSRARETAEALGYPVAVKPVVGHKGIGVTANIRDGRSLEVAFEQAALACAGRRLEVIVEKHLQGRDFRLLCVGGEFVAAVERQPPRVEGDGRSTIGDLIEKENATAARQDSPTSPLAPIPVDEVTVAYLQQQGLSLDTILEAGEEVDLRPVANVSSGGVSVGVTEQVHPDNRRLAAEIAQYFRLTCLGVDVITPDIGESWQAGNLGIIEINAAPGILMHLKPAMGESIDVPNSILDVLFPASRSRIPTITFNRLKAGDLCRLMEAILQGRPDWLVGGVCRQGIWLNRSQHPLHQDYNASVQSLLRHPQLDCLIAEYPGSIFEREGMAYEGSNWVVLDNPAGRERLLARDLLAGGKLLLREGEEVTVQAGSRQDHYQLAESEPFSSFYLRQLEDFMVL